MTQQEDITCIHYCIRNENKKHTVLSLLESKGALHVVLCRVFSI
uniref:Uncharacterized protein n=1 Tax=Anguilla anguilla TaxID=7936 RepID=A0A0E9VVX5_ANGAN